ncbi:MAG: hypothetical protein H8D45_30600 [Bacteroidetes bacterium]|nr:hypothetical protein [Bacteroidota bacterium]
MIKVQYIFKNYRRFIRNHQFHRDIFRKLGCYSEVTPKYYRKIDSKITCRNILFIFTGAMGDIVNAFTTLKAIKRKYPESLITWATLGKYSELVEISGVDKVLECSDRFEIPVDWIRQNLPDKIFFPEPAAHSLEWKEMGLHSISFIAKSCEVRIEKNRTIISENTDANKFIRKYLESKGVKKEYITFSHVSGTASAWELSRVKRFIQTIKLPVVLLGSEIDPMIEGAIQIFGKSIPQVIEIIRNSKVFIGPDSGCSWLATTTDVPMLILMDSQRQKDLPVGFVSILSGEKNNMVEGTIDYSVKKVFNKVISMINKIEDVT